MFSKKWGESHELQPVQYVNKDCAYAVKFSQTLASVLSADDKIFEMGGNLNFRDQEAYNKFLEALEIVYEEGRTVKVDGVSAISTHVKDGNMIYPLMVESIPTELVVGPSVEPVSITIDTVYGKKDIKFQRYQTKSNVVLETAGTQGQSV